VLKRYNSTPAVAQVRPEEWDCGKTFEDIPGPKPLPIIGNMWRFAQYIGNVTYWFVTPFKVHQQSESKQQKFAHIFLLVCFIIVNSKHKFIRFIIVNFIVK
jgi:hypothetical protein